MEKEFTKQAGRVLTTAKNLAKKFHHPYVGTEHLLLALRQEFAGVAGQVLAMNKVKEEDIEKIIHELISYEKEVKVDKMEFSPRLEFLLDNAYQEAVMQKSEKIGTEHMLLAMIKDVDCVATRILATLNVNLGKVQEGVLDVVGVNLKEYLEASAESLHVQGGFVEQFTTDLTQKAEEGLLDPVVGREHEIDRLLQVLSRRTKNNPCLVGEPGVGKTAIVEALATRIVTGVVPDNMKQKRILPAHSFQRRWRQVCSR